MPGYIADAYADHDEADDRRADFHDGYSIRKGKLCKKCSIVHWTRSFEAVKTELFFDVNTKDMESNACFWWVYEVIV